MDGWDGWMDGWREGKTRFARTAQGPVVVFGLEVAPHRKDEQAHMSIAVERSHLV
jgi:hypothetical protein